MVKSKLRKIFKKLYRTLMHVPDKFVVVDTAQQLMYLIEDRNIIHSYQISTSKFGIGSREGSNQTPLGIHRIEEKIGRGAPAGRIFKSRVDTGQNWHEGITDDNLILTRILRLQGLEDGINRGPGIDSFERYIYIHGTNQESKIGTPLSHGCVCMKNQEIIELFDLVEEGTIVLID